MIIKSITHWFAYGNTPPILWKFGLNLRDIESSNRLLKHFIAVGNNDNNSLRELILVRTHLMQPEHSWKWQSCAFLLHEFWVCYQSDFWDIDTSNTMPTTYSLVNVAFGATCTFAVKKSLNIMFWWDNFGQLKIVRCDFDVC